MPKATSKPLRERVKDSTKARSALASEYGFIPSSILRLSRGALSKRMFTYQREISGRSVTSNSISALDRLTDDDARARAIERKQLGVISNGGNQLFEFVGSSRTGCSIMPAELVAFFVRYYASAGQTYLDPFMGQGIQMQVAKVYGLHYVGYDASREFVAYIESVRKKIDDGKTRLLATLGDSRYPEFVENDSGDFCFTSPPYWDIEYYGDEPEQLGFGKSYDEFLAGMHDVYKAWRPKFKYGAWIVINVNDFRREGKFYPYHADTIRVMQQAGYTMHDTWIIDGLIGGLSRVWAVQFNRQKTAPKVHEYALVFKAQ